MFFAPAIFTFIPQTGSIAMAPSAGAWAAGEWGAWQQAWLMLAIYTLRGYGSRMDEKLKKSQLARLSRIEGQVRGVARMIEEGRYCIDVLTQIRAVRAALDKVEQETLGDHLQHCVAHAFHAGSEKDRQIKIDEILEVLDSRRR
jgi:DNA-binding FrmR family transcriptional regulator